MIQLSISLDLDLYRDRLLLLTLRQRQCMVLIDQGFDTKEIAGHLKISVGRVQKHIFNARKILGNPARRKAARLVAAFEQERAALEEGGQSIGALGLPLVPLLELPQHDGEAEGPEVQEDPAMTPIRPAPAAQEQAPFPPPGILAMLLPLRSDRRPANDLTIRPALITIAVLSAAGLVAAGSAMQLLVAFQVFLE